jgi:hypothetical protein
MMEHAQLDWTEMAPEEVEMMLRPLQDLHPSGCARAPRRRRCWRRDLQRRRGGAFACGCRCTGCARCSTRGASTRSHPAFPFADQETFIEHFIATVDTLRADAAA